ncbi:MAG: TetR/AcrR family transcriptional regulator [Ignavibacteriales bacterium]|nr:TetR/AcrR family transcriptional regulator [Ignavibacteriales bacterium]
MPEVAKDDVVRDAILQAAERVFQKWGLNKTTMEDIAREAKKGKSTLYYYFESKEEIFDTVAITSLGKVITKAMAATQDLGSAKEKIKKYIATLLIDLKSYGSLYSIVRNEIKRNHSFIERIRDQFDPREEEFIRGILRSGLRSGELTFFDENGLSAAVKAIIGITHALEIYLLVENDDLAQIDIAAKMITEGL